MASSPQQTWLVRSRLVGSLPLSGGRALLSHVLGRTRVVCSESALAFWRSFEQPRAVSSGLLDEANEAEGLSPEGRMLQRLLASLLLRAPGNGEAERISHLYGLDIPEVDWPIELCFPLRPEAGARFPLEGAAPSSSHLFTSRALAVLPLPDETYLATHPAKQLCHLSAPLWKLSQRFSGGGDVAACARAAVAAGEAPGEAEVLCALRFLEDQGLLWPSEAAEVSAAEEVVQAARAPDVEVLYPPLGRWRQSHRPYQVADVSQPCAQAEVALLGPCKIQQSAAALERMGRRAGWALSLTGFIWPEEGLSKKKWLAVAMPSSQFAVEVYESLASEDEERCRKAAASFLRHLDEALRKIRSYTQAPLLVFSLGRPRVLPGQPSASFGYFAARLLADINVALLELVRRRGPARLLDEERMANDFRAGVFWDDEFNASAHHSPLSSWNWVVLKPGETDFTYEAQEVSEALPIRAAGQRDPTSHLALSLLRELSAMATQRVKLVVFEPNGLLWPGKLESGDDPYVQAPTYYADVEQYFYSGLHEALAIVKRRGIQLACASSCPSALLRERWQVKSKLQNVVRLSDIDFLCGGPDAEENLRRILQQSPVAEGEVLWVDLGRQASSPFAGRRYTGNRWQLRRYLLSAPEMAGFVDAASQPRSAE
jgi:hypothetical protein